MIRSRELRFVPPRPQQPPLLTIEKEREGALSLLGLRIFQAIGHGLGRLSRSQRSLGGWGTIAFYPDSVHVVRDPSRRLGERSRREFDIAYEDITRLEFIRPGTLVLGFGLVTPGLNQQIVLELNPLEAEDKFDCVVEFLEGVKSGLTYSIRDEGRLSYSKKWTWEQRFPEFGMVQSVTIKFDGGALLGTSPHLHWGIVTDGGEIFDVVSDHGLVVTARNDPERALMQVLHSQILDGTGFALSLVEWRGRQFGIRTSHDEFLWIDEDGDVWFDHELIGSFPLNTDLFTGTGLDRVVPFMGSSPKIVPESPEPMPLKLIRPMPKAWVLALAVAALVPRHADRTKVEFSE